MESLRHLALIPDGNRRLAKKIMERPWKGHELGIGKLYDVLDWCKEIGIRNITFYALSLENLDRRPKDELDFLFLLAKKEFDSILTDTNHFVHRNEVKVTFFGRTDLLPQDIQKKMTGVKKITGSYDKYTLNLAMAYGGKQEILNAVQSLVIRIKSGDVQDVTEETFRQQLQTNGSGDPDLILRTGGEKRLSNFLTFQSAYSELAFMDTYWPELTKQEFIKTIRDFKNRQRRFGK